MGGTLKVDATGHYSFSGTAYGGYDGMDYDPKGEGGRVGWAELATRIIHDHITGNNANTSLLLGGVRLGGEGEIVEGVPLVNSLGQQIDQLYQGAVAQALKQAGGGCFAAGVMIARGDGHLTPIEAIRPGDLVAAYDGLGALTTRRVVTLSHNITDTWIELSNGLVVTPGHRFLTPSGAFASIADILNRGGKIVLADGAAARLTGREIRYSEATSALFEQAEGYAYDVEGGTAFAAEYKRGWKTYNFEVEDLHTYVAGGVRVHNTSPPFMVSSSGQTLTEQITLVYDQQSGRLIQEAVYLPSGYDGPIPTSTVAFNPAGYISESTGQELFRVVRDRYDPDTNTWSKVINYLPAPSGSGASSSSQPTATQGAFAQSQ